MLFKNAEADFMEMAPGGFKLQPKMVLTHAVCFI